jgi:hypothetical protein
LRRAGKNTSKHWPEKHLKKLLEIYPMRKLILVATALAFVSSTALAQDKAGGTAAPTAQSSDGMSKGDASKDKMAPKKMAKKSAKKSTETSGNAEK